MDINAKSQKIINKNISVRLATLKDANNISQLMLDVYNNLTDKTLYVCNDIEYVKEQLSGNGFGVVAEYNGDIVGSFILRYPGMSESNIAADAELCLSEYPKVIHFESLVVKSGYRGLGIGYKMVEFAYDSITAPNIKHCFATVAPHNGASLSVFMKAGFRPIIQKEKYNGLKRIILYKQH